MIISPLQSYLHPARLHPPGGGRRAVALVIVLAFVVLLTGVTVAFFSSSLLYRQISNSSASESKVDLFTQGAVDIIVGDLRQEIAAGSNTTFYTDANGTVVGQVYRPFNANTAVPAQALKGSPSEQSGVTSYAPNLVKRSAYQQNFFPFGGDAGSANYNTGNTSETISASATPSAAPPNAASHSASNRAANVATTAASQNGRLISLARWNKPLLLPKAHLASDIDFTPINPANAQDVVAGYTPPPTQTSEFVAPDWVLVARDGSNPAASTYNSNMAFSSSNASSIIGRYAYAIYDEGGTLDANVAGCPLGKNQFGVTIPAYAFQVGYKNVAAYADLAQLPGITVLSSTRQQQVIQSLVGWRNYATAQPTSGTLAGANYNFGTTYTSGSPLYNFTTGMLTNTHGFLRASNTALFNGQTDRAFASRQELIRLFANGIAQQGTALTAVSDRANIQNALQYLGTFSRDVNQPSYIPPLFTDPSAPAILQDGTASTNGINTGGNNAYGGDKIINPSFLEKRVSASFTRNDGTTAAVGEPLVLRRFALNRLAWVTYRGPSSINMTDPVVQASINALGGNPANTTTDPVYLFVQQGTAANIYKQFGLTWDGTNHYWVYDHNSVTPPGAPPVPKQAGSVSTNIFTLDKIAGREPDYFELLKASISVGSLGKHGSLPRPDVGANSNLASSAGTLIQYRRDILVDMQIFQIGANMIDQFDADNYPTRLLVWDPLSSSPGTREIAGVENLPYLYRTRCGNVRLQESTADPMSSDDNQNLSNTGAVASMIFPEIWNPHDANSTVIGTGSGIAPVTSFRVVMNSVDPDHIGSEAVTDLAQDSAHALPNAHSDLAAPFISNPKKISDPTTSSYNSSTRTPSMTFSVPSGNTTLFREPTVLIAAGQANDGSPSCTLDPDDQLSAWASGGGLRSSEASGANVPGTSQPYLACNLSSTTGPFAGLMIGRAPLKYWETNAATPYTYSVNALMGTIAGDSVRSALTIRLQYQDAWGNYVTYCEKAPPLLDSTSTFRLVAGDDNTIEDGFDPRTARFGMMQNRFTGRPEYVFSNPGAQDYRTVSDRSFTDSTPTAFLNQDFGRGLPQTPDFNNPSNVAKPASGWSGGTNGWYTNTTPPFYPSCLIQNDPKVKPNGNAAGNSMYADPDGVVRRAMGGFMPQTWPSIPAQPINPNIYGNPLVTGGTLAASAGAAGSLESRPMILNRPFRNVAELGYVYRDTPWKNLDFFSPESASAALLDVFCINDTDSTSQLQAGKVSLNTRQEPVIKAILGGGTASAPQGAYRDEEAGLSVTGAAAPLSPTEAANFASYAFTPWRNSAMAPAKNLAEFVSRWNSRTMAANFTDQTDPALIPSGKPYGIDGGLSYVGLGSEMSLNTFTTNGQQVFTTQPDASWNIQRLREAPMRALTAVGQTRTWNLMIDVIAQTGRYPASAGSLSKFVVEGEQRYWVHLAIDRYTGQVVDEQIEVVKE